MNLELVRVKSCVLQETTCKLDEVKTRTLSMKQWTIRFPLIGTILSALGLLSK